MTRFLVLFLLSGSAFADLSIYEALSSQISNESPERVSTAIQVFVLLTVLSLAPSILIMVTAFIRIVIVLSMLRHAFGMPQTPPNIAITSLADLTQIAGCNA